MHEFNINLDRITRYKTIKYMFLVLKTVNNSIINK